MTPDSIFVVKTISDHLSSFWFPLLTLVIYIATVIITNKRQHKTYQAEKEKMASDFKDSVTTQIATLQASVITWPKLDDHRKENEGSIQNLHGRIDKTNEGLYALAKETNGKLSDVSLGISAVKNSIADLADSFNRHNRRES